MLKPTLAQLGFSDQPAAQFLLISNLTSRFSKPPQSFTCSQERRGKGRVKISAYSQLFPDVTTHWQIWAHTLIHAIVSISAERPLLSTKDKNKLKMVESNCVKLSIVGDELHTYPFRKESSFWYSTQDNIIHIQTFRTHTLTVNVRCSQSGATGQTWWKSKSS